MTSTAATPDRTQEERRVALERRDKILDFVGSYGDEIDKLAAPGMNADYQVASLRLYFAEHPQLLDCKPLSIATGVLRVAQTGLTLGVSCDLLPFGMVCQFSPRYTGIIELALSSGVRAINTGVVREGDHFVFDKGTDTRVSHQPIAKSNAPITHAYALAEIKQGAFSVEVMTREMIDAHRQRYSKTWWTDKKGRVIPLEEIPWYGKKTCVRQLSPVLPKNARLAAALMFAKEAEEAEEEIPEGTFEVAEPVRREPFATMQESAGRTDKQREQALSREPGEETRQQDDRDLDDFPGRGRR